MMFWFIKSDTNRKRSILLAMETREMEKTTSPAIPAQQIDPETAESFIGEKKIGERIKRLRLKKSMGLVELGKHTGLSASFLSQLETGRVVPRCVTWRASPWCSAKTFPISSIPNRGPCFECTGNRSACACPRAVWTTQPTFLRAWDTSCRIVRSILTWQNLFHSKKELRCARTFTLALSFCMY